MKHRVADEVAKRSVGALPIPWRLIGEVAVGGLVAVGFASRSERLLIIGNAGQTIVDCTTGVRVFRDRERDGYCAEALSADTLDQLPSQTIRMSASTEAGSGPPQVMAGQLQPLG